MARHRAPGRWLCQFGPPWTPAAACGRAGDLCMAQHFLHSKESRNFAKALNRVTEDESESYLALCRWGPGSKQVCPGCGVLRKHYRRKKRRRWRCAEIACRHEFSVTSGTPFHGHKLTFKEILLLIFAFTTNANGASLLQVSRRLGLTPKSVQANFGKIREVLIHGLDLTPMTGTVHVDGGHFCGKPRKPNRKIPVPKDAIAKRYGKKKPANTTKPWIEMGMTKPNYLRLAQKRVVIVFTEAGKLGEGSRRSIPIVCRRECDEHVFPLMKAFVRQDAIVMTDESGAYNGFTALGIEHHQVKHSEMFSTSEGVNDNMCETFFSRMRRAEYGTYHGYRPKYLQDYAIEHSWRDDNRRVAQEELVRKLTGQMFGSGKSTWWRGYWQGNNRSEELTAEWFLAKAVA